MRSLKSALCRLFILSVISTAAPLSYSAGSPTPVMDCYLALLMNNRESLPIDQERLQNLSQSRVVVAGPFVPSFSLAYWMSEPPIPHTDETAHRVMLSILEVVDLGGAA